MLHDVSPRFEYRLYDAQVAAKLIDFEATPEAVVYFASVCDGLSDYAYWYLLSTCWVSYSGHSDIELWRRLFSSNRPGRKASIMKPSEVRRFNALPYQFTAYRAHRAGEAAWLSYTLEKTIADHLAQWRDGEVKEYRIRKRDVLALFTRRGEEEILVINP